LDGDHRLDVGHGLDRRQGLDHRQGSECRQRLDRRHRLDVSDGLGAGDRLDGGHGSGELLHQMHQRGHIGRTHPFHNAPPMYLDGVLAQVKLGRNLLIESALDDL
jgi:hypothetical protein